MDTQTETVGTRIKRLRLEASPRITQGALASRCGITRQAVNQWEKDRTSPSGECLLAAAKLLQVTPDYILHGGENSQAPQELDEGILKQAITDALTYMGAINRSAEDDPAKFAEVVTIQYRIRERETMQG